MKDGAFENPKVKKEVPEPVEEVNLPEGEVDEKPKATKRKASNDDEEYSPKRKAKSSSFLTNTLKKTNSFGKDLLDSGRSKVVDGESFASEARTNLHFVKKFSESLHEAEIKYRKDGGHGNRAKDLLLDYQARYLGAEMASTCFTAVGRVEAAAGRAISSAAKQAGREMGRAGDLVGGNAGAFAMNAILHPERYKNGGDFIADVGVSTLKQATTNVAVTAARGAAKELLPNVQIPGVNTIFNVWRVTEGVLNANTPGEVVGNVLHAGADMGISAGCATVGQVLIPIPFVGAFLGGFVGSGVIALKDAIFK